MQPKFLFFKCIFFFSHSLKEISDCLICTPQLYRQLLKIAKIFGIGIYMTSNHKMQKLLHIKEENMVQF